MRDTFVRGIGIALLASLCACSWAGPRTLRAGRVMWNQAVQQTDNEQLLLNLVRLRYSDTPFFLEVTSVSTNFTFTNEGEIGVLVPTNGSALFNLGASTTLAQNPTVTYTPVDGDQFVRELLSPIDGPTLMMLFNAGWGMERVIRVCVQSMNGVVNAPGGSGPTPPFAPDYEQFMRAAQLLDDLDERGALTLGVTGDEKDDDVLMRIDPSQRATPELRELRQILGLDPVAMELLLTEDVQDAGPRSLLLVTRSVLSALFYLSHNVDAPEEHQEAGKVGVSLDANGDPFEWDLVSGDLFQIRVSEKEPEDAYTRVQYRDHWFYIEDNDRSSKSTFALLSTLFMLQSRGIDAEAPILTLPVSR